MSLFKRALEPIDRISEVLFGLIMVLTFTGSLSVADAGRDDVQEMLIGALGCNIAWGIIDGFLYLMGCLAETGRNHIAYRAARETKDPAQGQQIIAGQLSPLVAGLVQPNELESIRQRLIALPGPAPRVGLNWNDILGAFGVFLLVFLSTFPVSIPFMLMSEAGPALRVSNAIAILLLFISGYTFGRITGRGPLWFGIVMVVIGAILVAMAIALGG